MGPMPSSFPWSRGIRTICTRGSVWRGKLLPWSALTRASFENLPNEYNGGQYDVVFLSWVSGYDQCADDLRVRGYSIFCIT